VIRHYDVNGKPCPGVIGWNADSGSESQWDAFHESIGGEPIHWYRVRLSWTQPETQIGAYTDLNNAKACADTHPGFSVYDDTGKAVYTSEAAKPTLNGDTEAERWINLLAPDAMAVAARNDLLASVMLAQASLETGWGKTDLAQRHNIFGMKCDLINGTWKEWSTWNGKTYEKYSPEEYNGVVRQVKSAFRVYDSYRQCMEDYAAFLLHVRNNKGLKYARIKGVKDPAEAIHIIRIGTGTDAHPEGYATDSGYEVKVLNLIRKYDLTKYDGIAPVDDMPVPAAKEQKTVYRVQIEADKRKANADRTMAEITERTGFDCFAEKEDGWWRVYCGSFEDMDNATKRRQAILDAFPDKYRGAFIKGVKVDV
jgi:flagellum-specific peptidoglycan hydrolase FlgJ